MEQKNGIIKDKRFEFVEVELLKIETIKVHAFTLDPDGGNPAGVVLQPNQLNEQQMKIISQRLQVSETAFVYPSNHADYKVRFFSPAIEVDLCGHATIATFTVLGKQIKHKKKNPLTLTQETKAGILPVRLYFKNNGLIDFVLMKQRQPIIEPVSYDPNVLARSLNISKESLCIDYPKERVSTGLFTLPVCVSSFSVLENMKPDFSLVKQFCQKHHVGSLHVLTFDTIDAHSLYHARNFAPVYDINEDPVTGTANGAVCSYLSHHQYISATEMICEQGDIIGKKGRVKVMFENDEIWVGGQAIIKELIELNL